MTATRRLILADQLAPEGVEVLTAEPGLRVEDLSGRPRTELKTRLAGASGLVVRSRTRVDADLLRAADSLRVIGRAGVGLDNIDVDRATRLGIAVLNAPGGNTTSTAELTFALLLAAARRIPEADRSVRTGAWDRTGFRGSQLAGKTLGVIGAGRIGAEVIRRARAFGMSVLVSDPYLTADRIADLSVQVAGLEELLSRVDFVTVHVPLTPETRDLLDEKRLALMRPTAMLINAARGGIVDEKALAAALREGRLAGAALDVFGDEPPPPDHPLRDAPNLVMTPHLGAATPDAQREVAVEIAEAMRAALVDRDIRAAVNLPPSEPAEREWLAPVLDLAGRLGAIQAKLAEDAVDQVAVRWAGDVRRGLRLVTAATLTGLLQGRRHEQVNLINARAVARERGIQVARSRADRVPGYRATLEVSVRAGAHEHLAVGGVEEEGKATLLRIDGYHVGVEPRGHILLVRNDDVPGVIGEVGSRLGAAGIRVAEFHQTRDLSRGEALAVLTLDEAPGPAIMDAVLAMPTVRMVREVELDG